MQRLLSFILRLVFLAAGLAFAAVLLMVGLAATLLLVGWSLVRGRRPRVVRFRVDPRSPFAGMRPGPAHSQADVVDIEAREIPDSPQQLKQEPR